MSEWSVDTLKELMDRQFAAQSEAVRAALASAERASEKADRANEKRFDAVNEFRGMVNDQQRILMPRREVEAFMENVTKRIDSMDRTIDARANQSQGARGAWGYIVAGLAILYAVIERLR